MFIPKYSINEKTNWDDLMIGKKWKLVRRIKARDVAIYRYTTNDENCNINDEWWGHMFIEIDQRFHIDCRQNGNTCQLNGGHRKE